MNIKKEKDFIIKLKTPTNSADKDASELEANVNCKSLSQASKFSKHRQSSQSLSYSDSFDSDSPTKSSTIQRIKRISKSISHVSSLQNRKFKKVVYGMTKIPKVKESTLKLLEANQIEISILISENADLKRKLLECTNELKTVQNQNKIQEKYLNKVNSRDSDIPSLISRYNAEIHSLQEQLRSKKEKLDTTSRQKTELDIELMRNKKKIEKLRALVSNKQLKEREELTKKVSHLTEMLETEVKKNSDLERSMELMTKKHNHQLGLEANKYKELKETYSEMLNELKITRGSLKEKSKLLEMQNVYSNKVVRAPHRLSGRKEESCELDESNFPVTKISAMPPLKTTFKEGKQKQTHNDHKKSSKPISKIKHSSKKQKYQQTLKTAMETSSKISKRRPDFTVSRSETEGNRIPKVLFYGDTPEMSDMEEKSESKFSDVFHAIRKNVLQELKQDKVSEEDNDQKNELLAKLKIIDENKKQNSSKDWNNFENDDQNITKNMNNSDLEELDVFCTSESEMSDIFSEQRSHSSSPGALIPRGHAGLMASRKSQNRNTKQNSEPFEFIGFSVNNNNNNSEIFVHRSTEKRNNYLSTSVEEIKID